MVRVFRIRLFYSAKWGDRFSRKIGDDEKIAKSTFSQNGHFLGFLRVFFGHPSWRPFFLHSGLLSSGNTAVEADTRETLQNKGFRSDVVAFYIFEPFRRVDMARFSGPVLRIIFCAVTILYGSMFEILSKLGFQGKKALGAAEPSSFWKGHVSQCVRCARKFGARRVRGRVVFFLGFGVVAKNVLAAAVRRVFPSFPVFFFFFLDPVFENFKWSFSHPPFFFGCFSLLFAFFLGLGATPHCTCVFGQLAFNPSYFLGVFGVFLEKHCFSPWKRVIWVHFSVSPFCVSLSFFLASFTSLCHTFSLSLSLFLLSCFFSSLLSCFYFYLPCFLLFFLVLLLRFWFHEKNNIKILHLKTFFS